MSKEKIIKKLKVKRRFKILLSSGILLGVLGITSAIIINIAANPTIKTENSFNLKKEQEWLDNNDLEIKINNASITPKTANSKINLPIQNDFNYLNIVNLPKTTLSEDNNQLSFSKPSEYIIKESNTQEGKIIVDLFFESNAKKENVEINGFLSTKKAKELLINSLNNIKVISVNPDVNYDSKYYDPINEEEVTKYEELTNISKDRFFAKLSSEVSLDSENEKTINPNNYLITGMPKEITGEFIDKFISISQENQKIKFKFNGFDFPDNSDGINIIGFKPLDNSSEFNKYKSDLERLKSIKITSNELSSLPNSENLDFIKNKNFYIQDKFLDEYINSDQETLSFLKAKTISNYLSNINENDGTASYTIVLNSGAKYTWNILQFTKPSNIFNSIEELYKNSERLLSNLTIENIQNDLNSMNITNNTKTIPKTSKSYWNVGTSFTNIEKSELKIESKNKLDVSISFKFKANINTKAPVINEASGTLEIGDEGNSDDFFRTSAKIKPILFWTIPEKANGELIYKIFTYPSIQTFYSGKATLVEALGSNYNSAGGNIRFNNLDEEDLPPKGIKIYTGYTLLTPNLQNEFIPNINSKQKVKIFGSYSETESQQNLGYFILMNSMVHQLEYFSSNESQKNLSSIKITNTNDYYNNLDNAILSNKIQELYLDNKIYFESKLEFNENKGLLGSKTLSSNPSYLENDNEDLNYNQEDLENLLKTGLDKLSALSSKTYNNYLNKVFTNLELEANPILVGKVNELLIKRPEFILKNGFNINLSQIQMQEDKLIANANISGSLNYKAYFDKENKKWINLQKLINAKIEIIPLLIGLDVNNNLALFSKYKINNLLSSKTNSWMDLEYDKNINETLKTEEIPLINKKQTLKLSFFFKFAESNDLKNNNLYSEFRDIFPPILGIKKGYFSLPILTLQYITAYVKNNKELTPIY